MFLINISNSYIRKNLALQIIKQHSEDVFKWKNLDTGFFEGNINSFPRMLLQQCVIEQNSNHIVLSIDDTKYLFNEIEDTRLGVTGLGVTDTDRNKQLNFLLDFLIKEENNKFISIIMKMNCSEKYSLQYNFSNTKLSLNDLMKILTESRKRMFSMKNAEICALICNPLKINNFIKTDLIKIIYHENIPINKMFMITNPNHLGLFITQKNIEIMEPKPLNIGNIQSYCYTLRERIGIMIKQDSFISITTN